MILFLILAIVLFAADIITKIATDGKNITVLTGIVGFNSTHNYGVAFSWFSNGGWILIAVISLLIAVSLFFYIRFKKKTTFLNIAAALFISGAAGNLFDRVVYGYVRDFIALEFMNFPIFNFADICLNISVVMLAIFFIFLYKDEKTEQQSKTT